MKDQSTRKTKKANTISSRISVFRLTDDTGKNVSGKLYTKCYCYRV